VKGKVTWRSGDTYEGDFKADRMNGKGTYIKLDKEGNVTKYEGEFLDN